MLRNRTAGGAGRRKMDKGGGLECAKEGGRQGTGDAGEPPSEGPPGAKRCPQELCLWGHPPAYNPPSWGGLGVYGGWRTSGPARLVPRHLQRGERMERPPQFVVAGAWRSRRGGRKGAQQLGRWSRLVASRSSQAVPFFFFVWRAGERGAKSRRRWARRGAIALRRKGAREVDPSFAGGRAGRLQLLVERCSGRGVFPAARDRGGAHRSLSSTSGVSLRVTQTLRPRAKAAADRRWQTGEGMVDGGTR